MKSIGINEMNEILEAIDCTREHIDEFKNRLDKMEKDIILIMAEEYDDIVMSHRISLSRDKKPIGFILKDVYNFIGENKDRYAKARGCIWNVDLRAVFDDMQIQDEWSECVKAMKRLGILSKGKDLTTVTKINGKSKRLHRVDMARMQDYLKGIFKG